MIATNANSLSLRRLRRRFLKGLGVAAAVTLAAFPAAAKDTIRVLAPASGSGTAFQALGEAYGKVNPDIQVVVQQFPSGDAYAQALLTQLQAGAGADLIFTNGGWGAPESLQPLAKAQRLGDLAKASFAKDFSDKVVPEFWADGKLYGLPLALLNVGLIYNAKELSALGAAAPQTFDDLIALCDLAQKKGKSALTISGASPFYFLETVAVSTVYNKDPQWNEKRTEGKVNFAESAGWKDAFDRIKKMIDAKCFVPGIAATTSPQAFAQLASGQALMAVGPTTFMGAVVAMNPTLDLRMRPFPAKSADETVAIGFYNDALSLNAQSKNAAASTAFLEWLSKPEQQATYAKIAGGTTPSDAAAHKFEGALAEMTPYFAADRDRQIPHHTWQQPQLRAALIASGNALFAGQKTGEQVLKDLDLAGR
ncbi:ABC transporter substrate-binding protein [Rhizobium puerariae]|uniref:ABC transporter substrate-binding protein n=1 Tax=Rhizobium puerariae TaxID=1585791 RepID=A0ABV6AJ92_9HYPH